MGYNGKEITVPCTEKGIKIYNKYQLLSGQYNIRTKTLLGTSHSWGITMRSLFYYFIKENHNCYLNSINGYDMCPKSWNNLINKEIISPDIDFTYTMPKNLKSRFQKESKIKLAIYNYETDILPEAWRQEYRNLDFLLPSSEFSKSIFVKNGWPEEKCIVVPHGVHLQEFNNKDKQKLFTNKTFKFLNVSIPHYRKNIDLVVDAYYEAFTNKDDVCLVLKTKLEPDKSRQKFRFEANVAQLINNVQKKYLGRKDLPQIEIFQDRVNSMVPMYNSCQVLVSASSAEGFGLPLLEGLAANMLVIAPRATGQLDFLNSNNSLLIDTNIIKAGERYQYWQASKNALTFMPIREQLVSEMLNAFKNYSDLKEKFEKNRIETVNKFTWNNAANKIIEIANENIRF